jgi:hypothetical protein
MASSSLKSSKHKMVPEKKIKSSKLGKLKMKKK